MKYLFDLKPKIILSITSIVVIIMIIFGFNEYNQSQSELYKMLEQKSTSLIETIYQASSNTLRSSDEIEDLIAERLLNNARFIKHLDSINLISNKFLINFAEDNHLFRINVFDRNLNIILSNEPNGIIHNFSEEQSEKRANELRKLLTNETDELVIGIKKAMYSDELRFAVAVSRTKKRGVIVINLDASELLEFRKNIGIGKLFKDISNNPDIIFTALQDENGIIIGNESLKELSSFCSDEFLQKTMNNSQIFFRTISYNEEKVFEVIKRFDYDDMTLGIFRIGLSLKEINHLTNLMILRLLLTFAVLTIIAIISLSVLFSSQNYKAISEEYKRFKSFTSSILTNMGEAILVLDNELRFILANNSAFGLFGFDNDSYKGKSLTEINCNNLCKKLLEYKQTGASEIDFEISDLFNGNHKYFLVNAVMRSNELDNEKYFTIVIKDITKIRELEELNKRNEKLSAMGSLAAGVAHEVRNPLNAIGMIAQRLKLEFLPKDDTEEYNKILQILQSEITRVNKIITQFLNYSKPVELNKNVVQLIPFFNDLIALFTQVIKEKNIQIIFPHCHDSSFIFDRDLIQQALINILKNAIESSNTDTKITLSYIINSTSLLIKITDEGRGIAPENLNHIFDLYFSTKKDGNGLGLSISQKIISQHNGSIQVESELNNGTTFLINLPK